MSHITDYTYLLNWTHLSVAERTHITHTHSPKSDVFIFIKKTTIIKFKNFSLSSLTVGPRRSHGSNRGSGGCDFGVRRMDNGGGCDSKPLLEDLHC